MTPKIDYFLFCENVIIGDRGRFTFANVFDEVFVSELPSAVKSLFVSIKATFKGAKANDRYKFELRITNPSKKVITKSVVQDFTVPDTEFDGVTMNIDASFMPIEKLGKFKFDFLIDGKIAHTRELLVKPVLEDFKD